MTGKSVGLGAPFRWLAEAFAMCRNHARILFGAASMLMLVALLPSLAQLLVEAALQPSPTSSAMIQVMFTLVSLFLFPPVVGGFYRIVHALHEGRAAHAFDLFSVFQDAAATRSLIVTNLIFVLASVVVIIGLAYAFGGQPLFDFLRAASTLQPGATELPPLPEGLLALFLAMAILMIVIATAQGLATPAVAVSGLSPLAAVAEAFKLALRNSAVFLLFYLPMSVLGFIVFMVFALVAVLIGAVLSLANPILAAALLAPVTLAMVLVLYALMFTFFYHAWRDLSGLASGPLPDHQIAA
jgi:hypothetical protein